MVVDGGEDAPLGCPCGSGIRYSDFCQPFRQPTAEPAKGFGFITPDADSEKAFAHISNSSGKGRRITG
jgi:hypothetical protein